MNIIITGATSFLGKNLVRSLIKDDNKLFLILNKNSKSNSFLPFCDNINYFYDIKDLEQGISYDAILHLAWMGVGSEGRKNEELQQENIVFSKNIFDYSKKLNVKKFIFFGSQAEIGFKSPYGKAKYEFAKYGLENTDEKINFIHLRIFSVYGPGDHESSLINTLVKSKIENKILELGKCSHLWNYLYVEDFAEITKNILYKINKNAEYDVASHVTKQLKDFVLDINNNVLFGKRENNVEGEKDLIPDISNLINDIGDFSELDFTSGIKNIFKYVNRRKHCIVCNGELEEDIFNLKDAPNRAQKLSSEYEVNDKDNLNLCVCKKCQLLQLNNKEVPYYKEVIRSGGVSSTMHDLRIYEYNKLYEYIKSDKYFNFNKKIKICECGSGKDEFLNIWKESFLYKNSNIDLIGYNYNQKMNFNFDIFTQFNFLEHQVEPKKMLEEIYEHLNDNGYGIITVPSGEFIYLHGAYYELIIDHIAYYSKISLRNLVESVGFVVLNIDYVNNNKDTLEIIIKKTSSKEEISINSEELDGERYINLIKNNLYNSYVKVNKEVNIFLSKIQNKKILVWGASHQGFTLINTTDLRKHIKYVVDSAEFKINKFIPGSNIKIIDKADIKNINPDYILILAPGYVDEITKEINMINNKINICFMKDDKIIFK